jgi:hypothetical protein
MSSLDVFEGNVDEAIKHFGNQLQSQENTSAGLLVAPDDVWPFSLMIFICGQIAKNSSTDIKKIMDQWRNKK